MRRVSFAEMWGDDVPVRGKEHEPRRLVRAGSPRGRREARLSEMSVPSPKNRLEKCMWRTPRFSPNIGSSALIRYFLLCLFFLYVMLPFQKNVAVTGD